MRLALLVIVLLASCEPAERCCEMLFPNRPSVADVLDGYAGRRVYNQNDLIQALGDDAVKRIVIAAPFDLGQKIVIDEGKDGLVIESTRGNPIRVVRDVDAVFEIRASRVVFDGLKVEGDGAQFSTVFSDGGFGPSGVVIRDVISQTTEDTTGAFIKTTGACGRWQVLNNDHQDNGSAINAIDVANGSAWYVAGNRMLTNITFGAGGFNRIVGNSADTIDTSGTGGLNTIVGNTANVSTHVDDATAGNAS